MPQWDRFLKAVLALPMLCSPCAAADTLTIQSSVMLQGFSNAQIQAAFKSTDPEKWRTCSTGTSQSCTATNQYNHPPKNVNNVLCFPQTLVYQVTAGCLALLQQNTSTCHKSSGPNSCIGTKAVYPNCQWRTGTSGTASWSWTMTFQSNPNSAPYLVDCSNSGYDGTH